MRYLNSAPFSCSPATKAFTKNYPFGLSKFERELAQEKAGESTEPLLKPCPWCGETPKLCNDPLNVALAGDHSEEYYVACMVNECPVDASTRGIGTIVEVVTTWNTRKA